mgnify:CR=1 FL=1
MTLLAEVGANSEGPLPWIERDYTPVSSAKEWETGKCDLLVKVYPDGAATSWLHRTLTQAPDGAPQAPRDGGRPALLAHRANSPN